MFTGGTQIMLMTAVLVLGLASFLPEVDRLAYLMEGAVSDYQAAAALIRTAPLLQINDRLFTLARLGGGEEMLFLVDNGCDYTIVDPALVDGENFSEDREAYINSNGRRSQLTTLGTLDRLSFGDLELHGVLVRVSSLVKAVSRQLRRPVRGVLGMRQMLPYLTRIDFSNGKIEFMPHNEAVRSSLVGRDSAVVLPLGKAHEMEYGRHIYTVRIGINGREVDAIIDLGFSGSIMTNLPASQLGITRGMSQVKFPVTFGGYQGKGCKGRAEEVEIGGIKLKGIDLVHLGADGNPPTTIIGVKLLRRFDLTFDYRNRQLILHPNGA
jgi:hypothetical protein